MASPSCMAPRSLRLLWLRSTCVSPGEPWNKKDILGSDQNGYFAIHWKGNVILTNFSSLAALEVVILTTSVQPVMKISTKLDMSTARWRLKLPQSLYSTSTHPTMVTHRLRPWPWMIDSHPFRSMSTSPSIPQIRLFQTLTLNWKHITFHFYFHSWLLFKALLCVSVTQQHPWC